MDITTAITARDRIMSLLREIEERKDDMRYIRTELRSKGFSAIEIRSVFKAAEEELASAEKRQAKELIRQLVEQINSGEPVQASLVDKAYSAFNRANAMEH